MKKAIFLRLIITAGIALLCYGIIITFLFGINEEKKTKASLSKVCLFIFLEYENNNISFLSKLPNIDRVTLLGPDGRVLFDSLADPLKMENHSQREEVKQAKVGQAFITTRKSSTLDSPYMYAAIKLKDGRILRLARQYSGLIQNISLQLPAIITSMLIVLFLATLMASAFSKNIVLPLEKAASNIASGNIAELAAVSKGYSEIEKIVLNIKELLNEIAYSKTELLKEKNKIDFILSNMAEGFVLLDEYKNILIVNDSAKAIFKCDKVPTNIQLLTTNSKIERAVDKAIKDNTSSIFDLKAEEKIYSVHISPVLGEYFSKEGRGITILLIDVTTERQAQQMRSEFFSNASHELKTPITSVLGFAEMLSNDLLSEDSRKETYKRIQNEAIRIASLINDILTISRLETNQDIPDKEEVSLKEVVDEVISALSPQALALSISVDVKCEDLVIKANKRQLYELISNLVENGIKYNKQSGKLDLAIAAKANNIEIVVADTGIGIPVKAQSRVFERFYRVDSGRTKSVGGTGLGLAIVKHIALSLNGEIALESKEDVGTKITVKLPLLENTKL